MCWWQLEDEKHPTFLDNRLLEGVELCYLFQVPGVRFHGSPVILFPAPFQPPILPLQIYISAPIAYHLGRKNY